MPETLNRTERDILDYLIDFLKRNTYQPSIREIGKQFSIKSTKTVSEYLQAIADKGYIERDPSRSRGVRILDIDLAPEVLQIPCYGKIAAGEPALLRDNVETDYLVDRDWVEAPDSFCLRIDGDSMKNTGILNGDTVIVSPASEEELSDGDVIAARVGGKAAIKHYYSKKGEVMLEPANPDHEPILVRDIDDFHVLGRVSGLFRTFSGSRN